MNLVRHRPTTAVGHHGANANRRPKSALRQRPRSAAPGAQSHFAMAQHQHHVLAGHQHLVASGGSGAHAPMTQPAHNTSGGGASNSNSTVLQKRVHQLEAMLDLQRTEYKERVERWDMLLNKKFSTIGEAPVKLKSLEDFVDEQERRDAGAAIGNVFGGNPGRKMKKDALTRGGGGKKKGKRGRSAGGNAGHGGTKPSSTGKTKNGVGGAAAGARYDPAGEADHDGYYGADLQAGSSEELMGGGSGELIPAVGVERSGELGDDGSASSSSSKHHRGPPDSASRSPKRSPVVSPNDVEMEDLVPELTGVVLPPQQQQPVTGGGQFSQCTTERYDRAMESERTPSAPSNSAHAIAVEGMHKSTEREGRSSSSAQQQGQEGYFRKRFTNARKAADEGAADAEIATEINAAEQQRREQEQRKRNHMMMNLTGGINREGDEDSKLTLVNHSQGTGVGPNASQNTSSAFLFYSQQNDGASSSSDDGALGDGGAQVPRDGVGGTRRGAAARGTSARGRGGAGAARKAGGGRGGGNGLNTGPQSAGRRRFESPGKRAKSPGRGNVAGVAARTRSPTRSPSPPGGYAATLNLNKRPTSNSPQRGEVPAGTSSDEDALRGPHNGMMMRSPPGVLHDHALGSPQRGQLYSSRPHSSRPHSAGRVGQNHNHGYYMFNNDAGGVRPQSAAPTRNRWLATQHGSNGSQSARPRTAPTTSGQAALNRREKDESFSALTNLQNMFNKVYNENQVLILKRKEAEDNLREFLTTKEGHQAKQIFEQRDLVKSLRNRLYNMEQDNVRATSKAKRCERRAYEEEMFLKQALKEIETLRQVTVELQRMNLELHESPQMKLIEQKLYKFQKGLTKRTKELNDQNDLQEKAVEEIWVRVEKVNTKVDGLYAMTEALQEDRNEAGVLLKVGRERIKECKQTLQKLAQDFQGLKQSADDSERKYTRMLKRQDEESSKIAALQRTYREILEEIVGNNKWYKRVNYDLEKENALLKKENTELLESLMAYLMLNQQSSLLKGKAKQALDPLAITAEKKRVPPPLDNRKANEEDEDENGNEKHSISTQPYPIHEPIDLPMPPPGAMIGSPRVLLPEKKVPLLLGEITEVQC